MKNEIMFTKSKNLKNIFSDYSVITLIISNLIVIALAITQNWNFAVLIWIYWYQSVIIGFFNFIRILTLKKFSTKGFSIGNKPAKPTKGTKLYTAFFFAIHYGMFHFCYIFFIANFSADITYSDLSYIAFSNIIFFINHLFSFLYNREKDAKKQNIGRIMFFPYARIIPMHLTLLFGSAIILILGETGILLTLILFLLLKTLIDVIMHIIEHE